MPKDAGVGEHPALGALDVEIPEPPQIDERDARRALSTLANHLVSLTYATRKLADGHATLTGSHLQLASLVRGFDIKLAEAMRTARVEAQDIGEITARTMMDRKELARLRTEQRERREGKRWLTRRAVGRVVDVVITAIVTGAGLELLHWFSTHAGH